LTRQPHNDRGAFLGLTIFREEGRQPVFGFRSGGELRQLLLKFHRRWIIAFGFGELGELLEQLRVASVF
jgi:hypothetical protein